MRKPDQASTDCVKYMRTMTEELAQAADRLGMPVAGWLYRVAAAALDDFAAQRNDRRHGP